MKQRKLGASYVSSIGMGCMGLSPFYGDTDANEAEKTVREAINNEINFFDVADIYGFGLSETILGKAIKPDRDKLIISSKCGIVIDRSGKTPSICGTNTTKAYIKAACERSLKRLGTDYIDLYYLHRIDPQTPIEESIHALEELKKAGKIRFLGLSQVNADQIEAAQKIHPITAVQNEYSLWFRESEFNGVMDVCRYSDISFIPYSPLGRGFLTNVITTVRDLAENDFRKKLPRFSEKNIEANHHLVDSLNEIAEGLNKTPAQIALAWILHKGDNIIPIPGMSKQRYIKENLDAINIELSDDILTLLDEVFHHHAAQGEQFPVAVHKIFSTFADDAIKQVEN